MNKVLYNACCGVTFRHALKRCQIKLPCPCNGYLQWHKRYLDTPEAFLDP